MEKDEKIELIIVTGVILFILSIVFKGLFFRFFLSYIAFIILPALPIVYRIEKTSVIEKFVLLNILGISLNFTYTILDVIFKIPLTKITYVLMTFLVYLVSYLWSKYKK